jgi:guanine deaminase
MDDPKVCPDDYRDDDAQSSIDDTKALIAYTRKCGSLVQPILTPRFALACTDDLLNRLRSLAADEPSLHIQTHIAENKQEVRDVKERFNMNYASVYEKYGLLRSNTILGHAVHLDEDEIELIAKRRAGISHCPTSNFNLSSGAAPIGKYLDKGIKVCVCGFPLLTHFPVTDTRLLSNRSD